MPFERSYEAECRSAIRRRRIVEGEEGDGNVIAPPVTYASRGESGPAGGGGGPMRITRGEFGFSLRSARIETRPVAIIATCRSRVQLNGTRVERVRDTRIVVHAISVRKSVPFRPSDRID